MTHLTSALHEAQFRAAELAIYAARIREAAERVSAIRGERTEDAR